MTAPLRDLAPAVALNHLHQLLDLHWLPASAFHGAGATGRCSLPHDVFHLVPSRVKQRSNACWSPNIGGVSSAGPHGQRSFVLAEHHVVRTRPAGGPRSRARITVMAFGQQSGPPATARQMQHLTALVVAAGHDDLHDGRGPLGLSQRQAAGRFTRDEADALIARLEAAAEIGERAPEPAAPAAVRRPSAAPRSLRTVPTEVLAAELQRRGWVVMEP